MYLAATCAGDFCSDVTIASVFTGCDGDLFLLVDFPGDLVFFTDLTGVFLATA